MGAGAGAQKITTDVTGNDTAGMVAGMVASGVTAKGLNGIEAEANKLAKAPKGIDGVTEGAGNLVEDVGKAGNKKVWRDQPREPRVQRKMLGRLLRPAMGSQGK